MPTVNKQTNVLSLTTRFKKSNVCLGKNNGVCAFELVLTEAEHVARLLGSSSLKYRKQKSPLAPRSTRMLLSELVLLGLSPAAPTARGSPQVGLGTEAGWQASTAGREEGPSPALSTAVLPCRLCVGNNMS